MLMNKKDARSIALHFGEAAAKLTIAMTGKISGEPMDEIERQLDVLIDGAPLLVCEQDIAAIRIFAREVAGAVFIASLETTPGERVYIVEQNDHLRRICAIVEGQAA